MFPYLARRTATPEQKQIRTLFSITTYEGDNPKSLLKNVREDELVAAERIFRMNGITYKVAKQEEK